MRRFTVATLVMAVALLTACDGDSTGNGGSILGTYTLQTWNGENLPVQALGGPPFPPGVVFMFELTAGSVRLNSDDTCSLSLTFRTTIDGTVTATNTETDTCTYSVTGTTIRLIVDPQGFADLVTGTISGNTLTLIDEDGNTLVLTK